MNYELNLQQFSGPIEKLLELIEAKKMEITELNLAEVTADFLSYIRSLAGAQEASSGVEPRLIADFVAVASRLLLIKSKALLPDLRLSEEEESDIEDLKERLLRYQQFKPAVKLFQKLYGQGNFSVSRQYFMSRRPVFYPAENFNANSLAAAMSKIFNELNRFSLESEKIEDSIIKLEEKIEEIAAHVKKGISQFSEITKEKSRKEIIVLFMALLHLLRDQIVSARQDGGFEDIIIRPFAE